MSPASQSEPGCESLKETYKERKHAAGGFIIPCCVSMQKVANAFTSEMAQSFSSCLVRVNKEERCGKMQGCDLEMHFYLCLCPVVDW